jgi:uncharacterized protein (TIGR02271 family)
MIDQSTAAELTGVTVRDRTGDKLGKVSQIYLDDTTGQPEWVTVRTGLFGTKESFVPLAAAVAQGDELVVDTDKDTVSGAPQVDENGHLSEEQEAELYHHYGMTAPSAGTEAGVEGDVQNRGLGRDTSDPTTDEAMTRSEERLRAGTQQVDAGRARLRKYVVTATQQVDVPVSREEVRLEREPITDTNRDAAYEGPAISEEEHEVTLRAERPVVETEAVPVERVRLGTETVSDTETVSGEVRKEQIEFDEHSGTAQDGDPRR